MTDRELDALVAEKVFLQEIIDRPWSPDGPAIRRAVSGSNPRPWDILPHYSTDIAAAWEVVEKMRESKWMATLMNWSRDGELTFSAEFGNGPFGWRPREYAESMTRAICLAALKAVGVEVP